MKETLKELIVSNIEKWTESDIYAVSLFVYDYDDDPAQPTVTLGYNTESQFSAKMEHSSATDEQEARWNYAFWLQNEFFCFGKGETAEIVRSWLVENDLMLEDDDCDPEGRIITAFVGILIEIVREIHEEKILTKKFGKELPVLIHELEYYDEIAAQNIAANGEELVKDFADFCMCG